MAYDARDGYTLLFGGGNGPCGVFCNDTWAFNGTDWVRIATPVAPSPRQWPMMTYDPFDGYVLLFGGVASDGVTPLADTWAFSGGRWQLISEQGGPAPRWAGGMAADLNDGYVLLFGGFAGAPQFYRDSWGYSHGHWTSLVPLRSPPPRWTPLLATDPAEGGVILYGGFNQNEGFLADTWDFSNGSWTQTYPANYPPPREKGMIAFDPVVGGPVLFGGDVCPTGCTNASSVRSLNDTWVLVNGSWSSVSSPGYPEAQWGEMLSFDWTLGSAVLLGEDGTHGRNSTVWLLSPAHAPPRLQVVAASAVPLIVALGTPATFVAAGVPEVGKLSFTYRDLPSGCLNLSIPLLSCSPSVLGIYTVRLAIEDGASSSGWLNVTFSVVPSRPPPPSPPPTGPGFPWDGAALLVLSVAVILVILLHPRTRRRLRGSGRRPSSERKDPHDGRVGSAPPSGTQGGLADPPTPARPPADPGTSEP
ncbi:MAG: hypothetical protein KGI98_05085 [Euryarchaeota archaeon]|nr:hypothetical protein [Euryarchaeota archaeon]MDE1881680.1 hypothetical protein [Euryarchaeota archaeon]